MTQSATCFVCSCILLLSVLAGVTGFDDTDAYTDEERYKGYSLLRLAKLSNMNETDIVLNLREKYEDKDDPVKLLIFDDIILPRRQPIRMITSSDLRPVVERHLKENNIEYEVIKEDISWYLNAMHDVNVRQKNRYYNFVGSRTSYMAPNYYMDYSEVQAVLTNWSQNGLNSHLLKTFSIGKTYEGRDTVGIAINDERTDLPAIWIDSGIEPSNWLSTASALYVAFKIINSKDESAQKLRAKYRWFFVPVVNPDGYEYAHESDIFWRKTRKPYDKGERTCAGVHLNKNFAVYWGGAGTTDDPCSAHFRGPEPFSEVESKNLKEALEKIVATDGSLHAYISIQNYGQLILSPWAGKHMLKPVDYDYLFFVGKQGLTASEKVTEIQEKFRFGTPPDLRSDIIDTRPFLLDGGANLVYICLYAAKKTNEWVLPTAEVKRSLLGSIKKRKLLCFGYLLRKSGDCLEEEVIQVTIPGSRAWGRPKMTCIDNIKSWTGLSFQQLIQETTDESRLSIVQPILGSRTVEDNIDDLTVYRVSGAVIDWVKDVLKVNWTYAIDVMPTSESTKFPIGHVVPANLIYASGEQTYDIIEAMVSEMRPDIEIDLLELYHGIRSTDRKGADVVKEEL